MSRGHGNQQRVILYSLAERAVPNPIWMPETGRIQVQVGGFSWTPLRTLLNVLPPGQFDAIERSEWSAFRRSANRLAETGFVELAQVRWLQGLEPRRRTPVVMIRAHSRMPCRADDLDPDVKEALSSLGAVAACEDGDAGQDGDGVSYTLKWLYQNVPDWHHLYLEHLVRSGVLGRMQAASGPPESVLPPGDSLT